MSSLRWLNLFRRSSKSKANRLARKNRGQKRISFEPLETRLLLNGQTLTWTGGYDGTTWSHSGNWSGGGAPGSDGAGDTLIFAATSNTYGFTNNNDISGLSLASIQIIGDDQGAQDAFTLTGNAVTLTGANGLQLSNSKAINGQVATVSLNSITLGASEIWINSCGTLDVTSPINAASHALTLNSALVSGATGATRLIATALRRTGSWLGWWLNQTGHRAPMPPSRAFASSLTPPSSI